MEYTGAELESPAPLKSATADQPCSCRTARWLRNPVFYVLGAALCAVEIVGGILRPAEFDRGAYVPFGTLLLLGWLSAHADRAFFTVDRWRRPRTYAALVAVLLIFGASVVFLVGNL